jgi:transposase
MAEDKQTREDDAERLRELLYKLDMLNAEAASYLKVGERTIYRWLAGERRIPHSVFLALELKPKAK